MTDYETAVRDYYEFVDEGAYDDLCALFAADVTYERPGQDAIEGMADFRAFYEAERPLEDGAHTIHGVFVDGDTAAVRGTFRGVQDGDRVEFDFADFHEFDGEGKITTRYTYTDRDTV